MIKKEPTNTKLPDNLEKYYFQGNKSLLYEDSYKLAIVGSRSITSYTKDILDNLFYELKNYDFTIISGGMYGVDIYAHNLSLKNNLKTIFVLPQGIESYKKSSLFNQLKIPDNLDNFLFLSKYSSDELPRNYTFLERNKIISNISSCVFVAQAGDKSGSFSTGMHSLKNSKKVFCPPFSLDSIQFQGTNTLISLGASIYLKPTDLLDFFNIDSCNLENEISKLLKNEPKSLQELSNFLGIKVTLLEKNLLNLILRGGILFDGEKYYL